MVHTCAMLCVLFVGKALGVSDLSEAQCGCENIERSGFTHPSPPSPLFFGLCFHFLFFFLPIHHKSSAF
uniref:Secreted protein n=1 Tax=Anguilla anguilla TaxID=7936 RepID=A0A0E9S5S6_ANGAN